MRSLYTLNVLAQVLRKHIISQRSNKVLTGVCVSLFNALCSICDAHLFF